MSFQFHKGSIRTNIKFLCIFLWLCCFNSIKVQLELFRKQVFLILCLSFNSIKVQLERAFGTLSNILQLLFQFHKGSIRTLMFWNRIVFCVVSFNSIKVQLEQGIGIDWKNWRIMFQFHKGSIRTLFKIIYWILFVVSIP